MFHRRRRLNIRSAAPSEEVKMARRWVAALDKQLEQLDARRDPDEVRRIVDKRNAWADVLRRHDIPTPPPLIAW